MSTSAIICLDMGHSYARETGEVRIAAELNYRRRCESSEIMAELLVKVWKVSKDNQICSDLTYHASNRLLPKSTPRKLKGTIIPIC